MRSTSIEPITSTEPTTTPRIETYAADAQPDQSHIQHIPLRDEHAENVAGDATTEQQQLQEHQQHQQQNELLNQISNESDDADAKDLNNFRHPATLITASNSEENESSNGENESDSDKFSVTEIGAASSSSAAASTTPATTTTTTTTTVAATKSESEDPYHVHILSENHDRLAEHADYQMLSSSTEEAEPATTTTTAATSSTTTESIGGIIVSAENKPTAEPETTSTSRARAMHMNEPVKETETATEKEADAEAEATTVVPPQGAAEEAGAVINIVEGKHVQHSHSEDETSSSSSSTTTTTTTTEATTDSPFVAFAGEGRSAGSDEDAAELLFRHNASMHHQALMDLSDVSMDEERTETITTTTTEAAPLPTAAATSTSTSSTTAQPDAEVPKIVEITASGDTMHRECLANDKSYKVSLEGATRRGGGVEGLRGTLMQLAYIDYFHTCSICLP